LIRAFAILVLANFAVTLQAHDVITTKITWTREVARIIYKHCTSCHQEDGAAFSLVAYQEARPWAKAIAEQVLTRRMPPWNAVKGFGEFKNDSGMSQEELEVISDWVEGGAPEGNLLYMPPPPHNHPDAKQEPRGVRQLSFSGSKVIDQAVDAVGIRPVKTPPSGILQAIAEFPDGRIEPLLWVQQFNPAFDGAYYFRTVLRFPKGTKIEITPPDASVALLIKPRPAPKPGH